MSDIESEVGKQMRLPKKRFMALEPRDMASITVPAYVSSGTYENARKKTFQIFC